MKLKLFALIITLGCVKTLNAQYTDVINSNRPGESMSAFAVGETVFQVETGLNYLSEKHNTLNYKANGYGLDLDLRYGFYKEEIEAILEFDYQNDSYQTSTTSINRNGLKNSIIGAKYLFYDPNKNMNDKPNLYSWKANHRFKWKHLLPAVAFYGGVYLDFINKFDTNKDETFSYKAMIITQNQFGKGFVFISNVFLDRISTKDQTIDYIFTLTKGFNEKWSGFLEYNNTKAEAIIRSGAAYLLNENMQIDASISKNFNNNPSLTYGGIGFSWRYDANYNDIYVRVNKKDKKKDKSTKGKEKEKTKKRLDEVEVTKP